LDNKNIVNEKETSGLFETKDTTPSGLFKSSKKESLSGLFLYGKDEFMND